MQFRTRTGFRTAASPRSGWSRSRRLACTGRRRRDVTAAGPPEPLVARLFTPDGREAAVSALAAFTGDIAAFDPARLSAGQATVLGGELRTLERRMAAVREALDADAAETAALADWREANAGGDGRLMETVGPVIAREVGMQAEAERWFARLDAARARFAGRLGSAAEAASPAGPSPAVIRSLSRVNAGLGAMLRDRAARRETAPDAMTRLRMWGLDALGVDPLKPSSAES